MKTNPKYKYFDNRELALQFLNDIKNKKYGSYELSVRDWSPSSRNHNYWQVLEIKRFK